MTDRVKAALDAVAKLAEDGRRLAERCDALAGRADASAFKKLEGKLARRKGVYDPAGLAAAIGRKKYGEKGMEKKAEAGRK
jgi:hypothetical protein